MNHRFVVPALGLIALSATAASAQEVAKGLFIDGYIDTIFTGATNSADGSYSTTDFTTEGVFKVGYNIGDKVKAVVATRTGGDTGSLGLVEAYGTVDAGNGITVSSGKSYGPFGYYSGYATGLTTVNYALSLKLYSANPVGVWSTYTVNDKFNVTVIVADGLANADNADNGKPARASTDKAYAAGANNNVSPGIDLVFNPTPEVSLDLEGYFDPNAGGLDGTPGVGKPGHIMTVGFNAQYKKDAWLVAGEVISRTTDNAGETSSKDLSQLAWAAFATYTIPETKIPMAATLQVSQYMIGKHFENADGDLQIDGSGSLVDRDSTQTKVQAALLTNPTGSSQFGLNLEAFYVMDDSSGKDENSLGLAIEGLYVIP